MNERYKRQEMIEGWDQKSLSKGRVLVVGAGTTGNEVIKNLSLLGVGKIVIVDKDLVEEVNLSRCVLFRDKDIGKPKAEIAASRARELNPLIDAKACQADIVHEIGCLMYKEFKCVVLTVDNLHARMWVNRYCRLTGVPLVNTGIEGWLGNVFTMNPFIDICLECSWTKREYELLGERYSCSKIGLPDSEQKIPMVITSAAIVGGIAAQEVVKILLGKKFNGSSSKTWWFDGKTGSFLTWEQPPKENCAHNGYSLIKPTQILDKFSVKENISTVKEKLQKKLYSLKIEIHHDKDIVYSVSCRNCGHSQSIQPTLLDNFKRTICPRCNHLETVPGDHTKETKDGYTFANLGIPAYHLLSVIYLNKDNAVKKTWIATKP